MFWLQSQPAGLLVEFAFRHHALPLAFASVGLNVKVDAGGAGVDLPDLLAQSFSPSLAPLLLICFPKELNPDPGS